MDGWKILQNCHFSECSVCCRTHNPHLLHGNTLEVGGELRGDGIGGKHIKGIFKYLEVIFEGDYRGWGKYFLFYFIDIVFLLLFRNFFHFFAPSHQWNFWDIQRWWRWFFFLFLGKVKKFSNLHSKEFLMFFMCNILLERYSTQFSRFSWEHWIFPRYTNCFGLRWDCFCGGD